MSLLLSRSSEEPYQSFGRIGFRRPLFGVFCFCQVIKSDNAHTELPVCLVAGQNGTSGQRYGERSDSQCLP